MFRPDMLIVDKEPMGLRGELEPTLSLLKSRGCRLTLGLREVLDAPELLRAEWSRSSALTKIAFPSIRIWKSAPISRKRRFLPWKTVVFSLR